MKPEIKRKWVKALLSGKYKQGTKVLYDDTTDTYCCLGVLEHAVRGESQRLWESDLVGAGR